MFVIAGGGSTYVRSAAWGCCSVSNRRMTARMCCPDTAERSKGVDCRVNENSRGPSAAAMASWSLGDAARADCAATIATACRATLHAAGTGGAAPLSLAPTWCERCCATCWTDACASRQSRLKTRSRCSLEVRGDCAVGREAIGDGVSGGGTSCGRPGCIDDAGGERSKAAE